MKIAGRPDRIFIGGSVVAARSDISTALRWFCLPDVLFNTPSSPSQRLPVGRQARLVATPAYGRLVTNPHELSGLREHCVIISVSFTSSQYP